MMWFCRAFFAALAPALRQGLWRRGLLAGGAATLALGLALTWALGALPPADGALQTIPMAASFAVNLLGLGLLLAWLPLSPKPWANLSAALASALLTGGLFAGVALAGNFQESHTTFLILWLLCAAQGVVFAALNALFCGVLGNARVARQLSLALTALATTALFWSKTAITQDFHTPAARASAAGDSDLAEDVLSYSPPLALACAWYQECDAARRSRSPDPVVAAPAEGHRFELVHGGRLTYRVWIGSYRSVSYPRILPGSGENDAWNAGLILRMLCWSVPALLLGEALVFRRLRKPA